jgi:hypothetical protein
MPEASARQNVPVQIRARERFEGAMTGIFQKISEKRRKKWRFLETRGLAV